MTSVLGLPHTTPAASTTSKASGGESKAKRGRRNDEALSDDDDANVDGVRGLVGLVGRLALSTASKAGQALALSVDILLIPKDAKVKVADTEYVFANEMKTAMQNYHNTAMNLKVEQRHTMGPPFVRAFEVLLGWGIKAAQAANDQERENAIVEAINELKAEDTDAKKMERICQVCRMCKYGKAHKKDIMKLEVSMERGVEGSVKVQRAWIGIMALLTMHHKAQRKYGAAPQANIQRQTVKAMKKMQLLKDSDDRHKW
eukprot:TRINITY_DN44144_c0_g1_i1.p2 TRINITY_DN44144_c0_g1~~TRINITY_DN44144_c0_g1_i1.p2  ORF type:complete len:258 (-),score=79.31 TRINITY_DN44144_c0_g1_i1:841-1614(-)